MSEIQDVAIIQIREVRHRISEQHGHDPQRVINYYLELQRRFAKRLLPDNNIGATEINHSVAAVTNSTPSLLTLKAAG
ncbi:MAG: hypothetical protein JXA33_21380 [Anaerolineae bacterium]|nr:hypothetical protein [Anaerolineae bacterium]